MGFALAKPIIVQLGALSEIAAFIQNIACPIRGINP
jgi:hypothetical protein